MSSSWDKKRSEDARLASIPYGLRQQMREQEFNAPNHAHQHTPAKRPESAFEAFTRLSTKSRSIERLNEATTSRVIMGTPQPMHMGQTPGTEFMDKMISVKTSPASNDGHTHDAFIDGHGNGYTSLDNDHRHDVKNFMVADVQDPSGLTMHSHPGKLDASKLPTHEPTPPYKGEP